ncbi:hypothetical protein HMP0015_2088 [Acinetobacter haemolyticus ATCC 19194]|uniref:Uncharacterized protein n=1 Tax=Acinetobacter haemolyticus ATCC 19194 TaxID=707232 RepID=D4XQU6_ACIHA|nr:hypothetical protein HMP0015_2088 [Acinetobacter haemolyticus ATCC 19194]
MIKNVLIQLFHNISGLYFSTSCLIQSSVFFSFLMIIYLLNILILYFYDILDRIFYKKVTSKCVFFFYNTFILQMSRNAKSLEYR